jgi:sigma-B regulation protein RsbU (phosphoserine phosphatase)
MSTATRVVHQYQEALDRFRAAEGQGTLLRPMSELISLLDLATTFNSGLPTQEMLDSALRIVMGATQAAQAALFVKGDDGQFARRAARGSPPGAPASFAFDLPPDDLTVLGPLDEAQTRHGLALLCPIHRRERTIAVLGLGPRAGGGPYGAEELAFLRSVAACAAAPMEQGFLHEELQRVNRELAVKAFQLHNLFDISREFTGRFEEQAIHSLAITTAMGHFVVSRCALYLLGPRGLELAEHRGLRRGTETPPIPPDEARAALRELADARPVSELSAGPLRRWLEEGRLDLAVPLSGGDRVEGVLAIGERASRTPFSAEDRAFALTLARQAFTALEGARLNRVRVEKQRQDHELRVAREIQRSLFPPRAPEIPGFEVAAESRSCYEVGGDCYDWIRLGSGRLALVVADVAGKGTPASLLMASASASVQALAGTLAPAQLIERLNGFIFARTQTNRYVTLFYAELDAASGRLTYVNAGHVPPYRAARDGTVSRLLGNGPALGLLDAVSYEACQVTLEPGDVLAIVTDGVTDANAPDDREFGDERVGETLHRLSAGSASTILEGLVAAVHTWAGPAGCSDDLTALILKAL